MTWEKLLCCVCDKNTASTFRRGGRVGFVLEGSNERVGLSSDSLLTRCHYKVTYFKTVLADSSHSYKKSRRKLANISWGRDRGIPVISHTSPLK